MMNEQHHHKLKSVKKHFNKRAHGFEQYSNWCTNTDFFDLCIKPFSGVYNLTCLDLGGGSGWIARTDAQFSRRTWFILDISYDMAKYSSSPVSFVNGDAHYIPFENDFFNVVLIRSVLHYVNPAIVMKETNRVLKKDSYLVIAQKVRLQSEMSSEWHNKFFELRGDEATTIWTLDSLLRIIQENDFHIYESSIYQERRKVDYARWLSRDGTIPAKTQNKIHELILSIPEEEKTSLSLSLINNCLEYNRNWAIIYANKKNIL